MSPVQGPGRPGTRGASRRLLADQLLPPGLAALDFSSFQDINLVILRYPVNFVLLLIRYMFISSFFWGGGKLFSPSFLDAENETLILEARGILTFT